MKLKLPTDTTYMSLTDRIVEYLNSSNNIVYCRTILLKQDHFTTSIQKHPHGYYEITYDYKDIIILNFEVVLNDEVVKDCSTFLKDIEDILDKVFLSYMIFKNKLKIIKD